MKDWEKGTTLAFLSVTPVEQKENVLHFGAREREGTKTDRIPQGRLLAGRKPKLCASELESSCGALYRGRGVGGDGGSDARGVAKGVCENTPCAFATDGQTERKGEERYG